MTAPEGSIKYLLDINRKEILAKFNTAVEAEKAHENGEWKENGMREMTKLDMENIIYFAELVRHSPNKETTDHCCDQIVNTVGKWL